MYSLLPGKERHFCQIMWPPPLGSQLHLHFIARRCSNWAIETGVLHEVGLRNTLEPDPVNTGVGSFRSRTAFFLEST